MDQQNDEMQEQRAPGAHDEALVYEPPQLVVYGNLSTIIRGTGSTQLDEFTFSCDGSTPDAFC